jgi:hypothetical protein
VGGGLSGGAGVVEEAGRGGSATGAHSTARGGSLAAGVPPVDAGTGASAEDPIKKIEETAERTKARNMTKRKGGE